MDQPKTMLQDLALLYVAMAHGTDHHLDNDELKVIARRMTKWHDGYTKDTVLKAIREMLEFWEVTPDIEKDVNKAVTHIKEQVPVHLRQQLLDDLVAVAWADNRFIYEESSLLGSLMHAWDLHPNRGDVANPERMWNVMDQRSKPGSWTTVHDLALVYLMLAHDSDVELSNDEVVAITKKIGEWLPNAFEDEVLDVVASALRVFADQPGEEKIRLAINSVKEHVPEHQRSALLNDLYYVASADRVILVEEKAIIAELAHAWDLPMEM